MATWHVDYDFNYYRDTSHIEMELCDCENEKRKCTDCVNDWRYLCRSQRSCDFGSGDGEYDNQRQSGLLWSCCWWCLSCCCLCPMALYSTFLVCVYLMYRSCRACLFILLCGLCYLCYNHAAVCSRRASKTSAPAPRPENDYSTTAEDIV